MSGNPELQLICNQCQLPLGFAWSEDKTRIAVEPCEECQSQAHWEGYEEGEELYTEEPGDE